MVKEKQSTKLSTRIDVDAKEIIDANNITSRSILEGYAYGCLFDVNIAEKAGVTFNLREEISSVKKDIDHLHAEEKHLNNEIEVLEAQLNRCKRSLNKNKDELSRKEEKLTSLESFKDTLKKNPVDLEEIRNERMKNAIEEVREILQSNEDKRNKGAFVAKVSEKKLNAICSRYKVKLHDVAEHLDSILIKGIENSEKYR